MTSVKSVYESDYIYFDSEDAEPILLNGEHFKHLKIYRDSYATVINSSPGDRYYGEEIWWTHQGGWQSIEPDTVPARLRAIRLLLDKGG